MVGNGISGMNTITTKRKVLANYWLGQNWDGIRCLAFIAARQMRLQSRELIEITAQLPELDGLAGFPDGTVLDGERVIMHQGVPRWHVFSAACSFRLGTG